MTIGYRIRHCEGVTDMFSFTTQHHDRGNPRIGKGVWLVYVHAVGGLPRGNDVRLSSTSLRGSY
jgi:hypothetical protein